jgi:hypothetical protein
MFCRTLATEILLTILALFELGQQNSYLMVEGDDEQPF